MSATRQLRLPAIYERPPLAEFFDSCPIPFAIFTGDLRVRQANSRASQILGTPAAELAGRPLEEIVPDLAPQMRPILSKVAFTGRPDMEFRVTGELKNEPGLTRHWLCSCFPLGRQDDGRFMVGVASIEVTDTVPDVFLPLQEKYQSDVRRFSQVAHWEWDSASDRVRTSAEFNRIAGLDPSSESLTPYDAAGIVHPADLALITGVATAAVREKHPFDTKARLLRPDGSRRVISIWGNPVFDAHGKLAGLYGVIRDLTEQEDAARALEDSEARNRDSEGRYRESEERFRDMVEQSRDVIVTHDLDGRLLTLNGLLAHVFSIPVQNILGRPSAEWLPAYYDRTFADYVAQLRAKGTAEGIVDFRMANGELRLWEYRSTLQTEGLAVPIAKAFVHDVTERVRAENALREVAARLQALINSIDDVAFELDADGRVLNVWGQGDAQLVAPREELKGKRLAEFLGEEFWSAYDPVIRRVIETGKGEDVEYSLDLPAGPQRYLGRITPITPVADSQPTVFLLARNITARYQAGRQLEERDATIRSLLSLSFKLSSTLDIDDLLDILAAESAVLLDVELSIAARRTDGGFLSRRTWRNGQTYLFHCPTSEQEGTGGWVLRHKRPFICNDAPSSPVVIQSIRAELGYSAVMTVPVIDASNEVIAFVLLADKTGGAPFTEDDAAKATSIVQLASFAIQNAISYEKTRQVQADLRQLSNRLLHTQDEERRRTAQFLHETTAQSLLILKMNLARASRHACADDPQFRDLISDSVDLVESSMQEIRTLSYLLHPPMLDEAGLAAALRWYGKGFSDRSGVSVHVEIPEDFIRLPREVEVNIFRIVQESLSNVHRHSGSLTATIRLRCVDSHVVLEIEDYGRGVGTPPPATARSHKPSAPKGVGISGMRQRVDELGGTFSVICGGGQGVGTTIRATIPLVASADSESTAT